VRLLGERKYGELLGQAKVGTNQHSRGLTAGKASSPAEHKARHEARQVARVPEPVFREYVDEAPLTLGALT